MFGRVTSDSIRRSYHTVRGHLYRGYGQAREFAQALDHGVELAARTYRAVQPILRDVAGAELEGKATTVATGLKSGYNMMRAKALQANSAMSATEAALRRKVPELGL